MVVDHADLFGVLTFVDPLIYWKAEYHNVWAHREMSVKSDWFFHQYICDLDRDIFQELPIFVPDILGSDKDVKSPNDMNQDGDSGLDAKELSTEKNEVILQEWIQERYSDLFIRMFDAGRTHRWCIVQQYNQYPYWRVFTYREVKEIKYDKFDKPISAIVHWAKFLPCAATYEYHEETLNFDIDRAFDKDPKGNTLGKAIFVNFGSDMDERIETTDLESKWSLDVYLRYIMLDIVNNSAKSSGFFWIKEGSQMDDTKKLELDAVLAKLNTCNSVGATENVIAGMEAMYMKNPEFPVEAFDKILKVLAGACDMPLLYFNGEKETGSIFEENSGAQAQINKKMRKIFGKFKKYILQLVEMRWGVKCDDVFPNIEEEEEEQYKEDIIEPSSEPGNGAAHKENIKVETK